MQRPYGAIATHDMLAQKAFDLTNRCTRAAVIAWAAKDSTDVAELRQALRSILAQLGHGNAIDRTPPQCQCDALAFIVRDLLWKCAINVTQQEVLAFVGTDGTLLNLMEMQQDLQSESGRYAMAMAQWMWEEYGDDVHMRGEVTDAD